MDDPFLLIRNGNIERLKELLSSGNLQVNKTRWSGFSLLHRAAEVGFNDACQLLVELGANINGRSSKGWYTPLHIACGNGHFDTALLLIDLGADPWMKSKYKEDPYDFASKRGFRTSSEEFRNKIMKKDVKRTAEKFMALAKKS
jgi:ankyrin repeat protein